MLRTRVPFPPFPATPDTHPIYTPAIRALIRVTDYVTITLFRQYFNLYVRTIKSQVYVLFSNYQGDAKAIY